MSLEELHDELCDETTELDMLSYDEIRDHFEERGGLEALSSIQS